LGYELVKIFLENNHKVAAGTAESLTPPGLAALRGEYPGLLRVFPADVTDEGQVRAGAALCEEFFGGKADALCNTAGVLLPGDRVNLIHQCDVGELRRTFEVNAIGAVIVGKYFYPVMKKGGAIFTVTSEGTGLTSHGTWVPCYALSKTAATKASAIFNASIDDVDFYAVHPGRMNTEMGRATAQIEPGESAAGFYRLMTGETPLSRETWYINYNGGPMTM
jgi:NAD(P)-dependent dehydrogenase (short-subunit alcohol dehydrogenase family)